MSNKRICENCIYGEEFDAQKCKGIYCKISGGATATNDTCDNFESLQDVLIRLGNSMYNIKEDKNEQ